MHVEYHLQLPVSKHQGLLNKRGESIFYTLALVPGQKLLQKISYANRQEHFLRNIFV